MARISQEACLYLTHSLNGVELVAADVTRPPPTAVQYGRPSPKPALSWQSTTREDSWETMEIAIREASQIASDVRARLYPLLGYK
jgi:hypothetical protein